MRDFVFAFYPWIKALHLISVIAWMAGLLYLPRLFVYHCAAEPGSVQSETFKVMERRLIRAIMNPAMIATWLFGILLLMVQDLSQGWVHAKLLLVVLLTGMHHVFSRWRKAFERDANRHPTRTFRIANEVPTALMIAIVILVIVKPF
jgi:protoporphyrinogen IX oxidase